MGWIWSDRWLRRTYSCWLFIDRSAVQLTYSFDNIILMQFEGVYLDLAMWQLTQAFGIIVMM